MLIGSMSSFTPRFSTQVSPSCSVSSNSKPYCIPEQPPPWMNTRSLRFGLPSPRIRSPTLRAAASVKTSVSATVSVMGCTLRAGLGRRNRGAGFGLRFRGLGGAVRQRDEFSRYDGARGHFNDAVVDIPIHAGLAAEHQPLARAHVAVHGAVHDDVGDLDPALDEAAFTHGKRPSIFGIAAHIAVHAAVEMQATRELEIAIEIRGLAQQRVDARGCLLASPEHDLLPRSAHCGSTLHTYDCCTGAEPRRLDLTSTRSCSGFMPGGMVISSSMFSRYRKVKGISRRFPPESVAKSARPGLPSISPSTDKTTTPLTTVSGFMGWTRVTRIRNLFAVAVATIRACWIFTSAEFAFWVT